MSEDVYVPEDQPENCPACGDGYESVSRHAGGFVVALRENDRYRRVCFHPVSVDGEARLDCYHHTRPEIDDTTDVASEETRMSGGSEETRMSGGSEETRMSGGSEET